MPVPNQSTLWSLFVPFWEELKVPETFSVLCSKWASPSPCEIGGKGTGRRGKILGILRERHNSSYTASLCPNYWRLLPPDRSGCKWSCQLGAGCVQHPPNLQDAKNILQSRAEQELSHGEAALNRTHLIGHSYVQAFLILRCRELKLMPFGNFKTYQVGGKFLQQPFIINFHTILWHSKHLHNKILTLL